ncbi:bvrS [Brucella melitensis]|nr:bvrS [Brucella melitensis]
MVSNLIENARSFVPDDTGRIVVTLAGEGNRLRILVEDNGPGIPIENIERIFERFYTDRPASEAFGRIPASACRSAGRSSRRMAAR